MKLLFALACLVLISLMLSECSGEELIKSIRAGAKATTKREFVKRAFGGDQTGTNIINIDLGSLVNQGRGGPKGFKKGKFMKKKWWKRAKFFNDQQGGFGQGGFNQGGFNQGGFDEDNSF